MGRISIAALWLSSNSLPSASCYESYAILDKVPGRTLRKDRLQGLPALCGSAPLLFRPDRGAACPLANGRLPHGEHGRGRSPACFGAADPVLISLNEEQ